LSNVTPVPDLKLVIGTRAIRAFRGRPTVVGRGSDADVELDHPNVSRP
jgi:hypothetical protein